MKTVFKAILVGVPLMFAAACGPTDPSGESGGDATTKPSEPSKSVASMSQAYTCGSWEGTTGGFGGVGGYRTKCSCGDYTLPCSGTQSVNYGTVCHNHAYCTEIVQRNGSVTASKVFNASTAWVTYYRSCAGFC